MQEVFECEASDEGDAEGRAARGIGNGEARRALAAALPASISSPSLLAFECGGSGNVAEEQLWQPRASTKSVTAAFDQDLLKTSSS